MSLDELDQPLEEEEYYPEDCSGEECYQIMQNTAFDDNGEEDEDDSAGPHRSLHVPGDVLSPGLPQYNRNSLMSLDTFQGMETDREHEEELSALENELLQSELEASLSKPKKKSFISQHKWHIMIISGIAVTVISIVALVLVKMKKSK